MMTTIAAADLACGIELGLPPLDRVDDSGSDSEFVILSDDDSIRDSIYDGLPDHANLPSFSDALVELVLPHRPMLFQSFPFDTFDKAGNQGAFSCFDLRGDGSSPPSSPCPSVWATRPVWPEQCVGILAIHDAREEGEEDSADPANDTPKIKVERTTGKRKMRSRRSSRQDPCPPGTRISSCGTRRVNRPKKNHAKEATAILRSWCDGNIASPWPSDEVKQQLARESSLTVKNVSTWFCNQRKRQLKPMIQAKGLVKRVPKREE